MTITEQTNPYKEKYGAWAGFPQGHKPDYSLCCEEVAERGRWTRWHQCSKKRGHGPDGAYCKQHDPEAVARRAAASSAKAQADWDKRMMEAYGKTFHDALVKIADGHNDARGLAQEVLDKFRSRR